MTQDASRAEPIGVLAKSGWVAVPLTLGKGSLFELEAEAGAEKLVLLLDSGASWFVLDRKAAERLKLALSPGEGPVGGLGTANTTSEVAELKMLRLGAFAAGPVPARVLDLSAINQSRAYNGDSRIDGLIGATFLIDYQGVISYPSKELYLKPKNPARGTTGAPSP